MTNKVLIFAGTTEGRILCEYFIEHEIQVDVCVATDYGETVLPKSTYLQVHVGRMDKQQILDEIKRKKYQLIIDATHPYAVLVTNNIKEACETSGIKYVRVLRESMECEHVLYVESIREVVEFLNHRTEKALITTGSKELEAFTKVNDYKNRLIVRVLPTKEVVAQCEKLGFQGKNLICMQGPCSLEMNYVTLKETGANYLVTKESGVAGGFVEKIEAAKKAGVEVIVIRRPNKEDGYSVSEMKEWIKKFIS